MSIEAGRVGYKENPHFVGKTPEQLRAIAGNSFLESTRAENPLDILGWIGISSDALRAGGQTVEDLGLVLSDVIKVVNRAYRGSAPEATAIHTIATGILASYPRTSE